MIDNDRDIDDMSQNKIKALTALIDNKNIREASKQSGISEPTLYRYLQDTTFKSELIKLRGVIVDSGVNRVLGLLDKSIDAMSDLLEHSENDNVKLATAKEVLAVSLKFKELSEFEDRLTRLEQVKSE